MNELFIKFKLFKLFNIVQSNNTYYFDCNYYNKTSVLSILATAYSFEKNNTNKQLTKLFIIVCRHHYEKISCQLYYHNFLSLA